MITEEQARQKWCPMARASCYGSPFGINRDQGGKPDVDTNCVASDCMMWRWFSLTHGYCGLAGKQGDIG